MLTYSFASQKEAAKILTTPDDFLSHLNKENVKFYTKSPTGDLKDYLKVAEDSCLEFSSRSVKKITKIMKALQVQWDKKGLPPLHIDLIRTNGLDAFDLPYTRHNAIILPASLGIKNSQDLNYVSPNLITHESFHILSRKYPKIKHGSYDIFGFKKLDQEIINPEWIINPDAPTHEYYIDLKDKSGLAFKAMLCLNFKGGKMNWGQIFNLDSKEYIDWNKTNLTDFIGTNTQYIIHPEEICAEYFRISFFPELIKDAKFFTKYATEFAKLIL